LIVSRYVKRGNGRPVQITRDFVEDLSSMMKGSNGNGNNSKAISWRRAKVLELASQGNSQVEIAKTLRVGEARISRDLSYLRQEANENLRTHIQGKLPEEY
jgi:Trp operon repressor